MLGASMSILSSGSQNLVFLYPRLTCPHLHSPQAHLSPPALTPGSPVPTCVHPRLISLLLALTPGSPVPTCTHPRLTCPHLHSHQAHLSPTCTHLRLTPPHLHSSQALPSHTLYSPQAHLSSTCTHPRLTPPCYPFLPLHSLLPHPMLISPQRGAHDLVDESGFCPPSCYPTCLPAERVHSGLLVSITKGVRCCPLEERSAVAQSGPIQVSPLPESWRGGSPSSCSSKPLGCILKLASNTPRAWRQNIFLPQLALTSEVERGHLVPPLQLEQGQQGEQGVSGRQLVCSSWWKRMCTKMSSMKTSSTDENIT